MALHFMAKPCRDYYRAKVWKLQTTTSFNFQKLAENGVPYNCILNITGGIYFNTFSKMKRTHNFSSFFPHFVLQIFHKTGRIFEKKCVLFGLNVFFTNFQPKKNPDVLKVRQSRKQILKFSFEPKIEQKYFSISALGL